MKQVKMTERRKPPEGGLPYSKENDEREQKQKMRRASHPDVVYQTPAFYQGNMKAFNGM